MRRALLRKSLPTAGDVHVNRPLTNVSVAYIQDQTSYVADRVFPQVRVNNRSNEYFVYSKSDWLRDEAKERAPATQSAGGGFRLTTDNYFAKKWAWHQDVDDDTRANADPAVNPDRDATAFVTQVLLTKREVEFMANYFVTGIWGTETTPATLWSDPASTPIEDIDAAMIGVVSSTGYRPNVLLVHPNVHNALKNHPDVVDRYKYTQAGIITPQLLARLFSVESYLVAWSVVNSAPEGAAADATDFVAGENALLVYRQPQPSLMRPSGGYIFSWTGLLGAGAYANRIKRFRMEEIEAFRVEGEMAFDQKLVAADVGHLFLQPIA